MSGIYTSTYTSSHLSALTYFKIALFTSIDFIMLDLNPRSLYIHLVYKVLVFEGYHG